MRRHYLLALASSASLALLAAAGCSSSDEGGGGGGPSPDASTTPDSSTLPDDASTPDGGSKPEAGPHEPGWDPSFSLPGVAGTVTPRISAMARIANRQIALAGDFLQAGSIPAQYVALWNGNAWLSIDTGLPGEVERMVATPTGELFGAVRSDEGTKLFKWNKTAWSELASFDDVVEDLEVAPDGTLYAAGSFTHVGTQPIASLAKLTGNTWSEVAGAPQRPMTVRVVAGKVCVGGFFEPWNPENYVGLQCLEGGTWSDKPFPADAYGHINDIGEQNGELIAAGQFLFPEESEDAGSLARWDGSKWVLIGGGLVGFGAGEVMDMEIDGDKIYVTGQLSFAGGMEVNHVAMWDVTQKRWSSLNDGVFGKSGGWGIPVPPGRALVKDQGGEIYVSGQFSLIGGRSALGIARWDGNQWNPVDDPKAKRLGVNGSVSALAEGPDGEIYAGGVFPLVGGDVAANKIARFQNDAWTSLGLGFDQGVNAIAVKGSTVFAGGDFLRSGPVLTRSIAQWNGSSWSAVGSGVDGQIATMAVGPDGSLYVGGDFTEAGGVVANNIAKWDGTKWSALGDGFDRSVGALGFDASGKLHAGGSFTKSGNADVNHIAVWNGTTWSTVGTGVNADGGYGGVSAIVMYDGKLTIGGMFDRAGNAENAAIVGSVAAWDGTAWVPVGGGFHGYVETLAARNKELYVGGAFNDSAPLADGGAGPTLKNIAMWNGSTWSDVGGGMANGVSTILMTKDCFWAGGNFTFAGNRGSYNIARFWFN